MLVNALLKGVLVVVQAGYGVYKNVMISQYVKKEYFVDRSKKTK